MEAARSSRRAFTKAPSAELRPNQTDQDSLPPYDLLDRIINLYVEENRSAGEIAAAGFDAALVRHIGRSTDQRIQAQAGPAGPEGHQQGLRLRAPHPIVQSYRE